MLTWPLSVMPVSAAWGSHQLLLNMCRVCSPGQSHRSHSESCAGQGGENGEKDSGKLHQSKNQMAQCLPFALADDRIEAMLFSLLVLFPAQKAALVCLPSGDLRPHRFCSVCGYVLALLRDEAVPRN